MAKLRSTPKQNVPFVIAELPDRVFCPVCHVEVRAVVPSVLYLYLLHVTGAVCVVDNVQGHWDVGSD